MKKGFGALDLLIGLVIMSIIFILYANAFKGMPNRIKTDNSDESVQQYVDKTVNEIEVLRRQRIEYEKKLITDSPIE